MALISQEGLAHLQKLSAVSPTLSAAYLMDATKTASQILVGRTDLVPHLSYLKNPHLPFEKAVDYSFIHSLFTVYREDLPHSLLQIAPTRFTNLLNLIWNVHRAIQISEQKFPGLLSIWKSFVPDVIVSALNGALTESPHPFYNDLLSLLENTESDFYKSSDVYQQTLIDLLNKHFSVTLPPIEQVKASNPTPTAPTTTTTPVEENQEPQAARPASPVPEYVQPEQPNDLLESILNAVQQLNDLERQLEAVASPELPNFGQSDQQISEVQTLKKLRPDVLIPTIAGNQVFNSFTVPITPQAQSAYSAFYEALRPYIYQLRNKIQNIVRNELTMQTSYSGRVHSQLIPKALAANVSPFVRLETEEGTSMHLVFLIDESGSMGTTVNNLMHVELPKSRLHPLLGGPSPVASNRIHMAKLAAILFYEAAKTSDMTLDFFGYGDTLLPAPLQSISGEFVRRFTLPYSLASISAFSGNGDLSALSQAYYTLKDSPSRHKVIVYLADGEVTSEAMVKAFDKVHAAGIRVFWLDMSGRSKPYNQSALLMARRFSITTFQDLLQAYGGILEEFMEWYG